MFYSAQQVIFSGIAVISWRIKSVSFSVVWYFHMKTWAFKFARKKMIKFVYVILFFRYYSKSSLKHAKKWCWFWWTNWPHEITPLWDEVLWKNLVTMFNISCHYGNWYGIATAAAVQKPITSSNSKPGRSFWFNGKTSVNTYREIDSTTPIYWETINNHLTVRMGMFIRGFKECYMTVLETHSLSLLSILFQQWRRCLWPWRGKVKLHGVINHSFPFSLFYILLVHGTIRIYFYLLGYIREYFRLTLLVCILYISNV